MFKRSRLADKISFDIFLAPAEMEAGRQTQWPPNRFADRDRRLLDLENLWYGNFNDFLTMPSEESSAIVVNLFLSYSTKLADLLTMEKPQGIEIRLAYDAIIDMSRYGGAILREMDGELDVADPTTWYPVSDGGHAFVVPIVSDQATDSTPDRAEVWVFSGERYEMDVRAYSHGYLGGAVEEGPSGSGRIGLVPRKPTVGDLWGTSKYTEIFGPCLEITNRAHRNSRVLDLNGRPIPVMTISDTDAEGRFNIDTDEDSDEDVIRKIQAGGVDINQEEVIRLPDDVRDFKFEQPNVGGVQVALMQIEKMQQAVAQLTGMPSLSGEFQPPSGESLKRILLHFYAETRSLQNDLIEAIQRDFGITVTWEHIFDVLEARDLERAREAGERLDLFDPTALQSKGQQ